MGAKRLRQACLSRGKASCWVAKALSTQKQINANNKYAMAA